MSDPSLFQLPPNVRFDDFSFFEFDNFLNSSNFSSVVVLVDENTKSICFPYLKSFLENNEINYHLIEVREGEASKSLEVCSIIWEKLTDLQLDRKGLLVNLGGGVITDLGGFVASVYKRGLKYVNIPTSILAMVDAAVGGNCGVNFGGFKNLLGVFNPSSLCLIVPQFLETLPKDELQSGSAEIIKYSFLEKWVGLEEMSLSGEIPTNELIKKSIEVKSKLIKEDLSPGNYHKVLNLGHTIGHAIEGYCMQRKTPIKHGIAIAAGLFVEIEISLQLNLIGQSEGRSYQDLIIKRYQKVDFTEHEMQLIEDFLKQDKKNVNGKCMFSLLKTKGNCEVDQVVTDELIRKSLKRYILQK